MASPDPINDSRQLISLALQLMTMLRFAETQARNAPSGAVQKRSLLNKKIIDLIADAGTLLTRAAVTIEYAQSKFPRLKKRIG